MTAPEFARPRRLDTLGEAPTTVEIAADSGECAALARRFGLVSLDALSATWTLRRTAAGVDAGGRVTARAVGACIATGEGVPATIDETVALRFVIDGAAGGGGDAETELASGDMDTVFVDGGAIDLGEATAETLALALDPYPRSPAAAAALAAAGVRGDDEPAGGGAFAGLKDLLGG